MMMLSVEKKNRERHGREIKRSSKGNLLLIALQPRTFGCYQGGGFTVRHPVITKSGSMSEIDRITVITKLVGQLT